MRHPDRAGISGVDSQFMHKVPRDEKETGNRRTGFGEFGDMPGHLKKTKANGEDRLRDLNTQ